MTLVVMTVQEGYNAAPLHVTRAGELTISGSQLLVSIGIGLGGTSLFGWSFVHYWLFAR
jgi:hypothetical protein